MPVSKKYSPLCFAQVRVDRFDYEDSLQVIQSRLQASLPTRVYFLNTHCVNTAQDDAAYREAIGKAEYVFNDGAGIELAGKALGYPMPCNLNGTDWIPKFFDSLSQSNSGARIFLLGARESALHRAQELFACRWPGVSIVGIQHGFFDKDHEALEGIRESGANVLLSVMGVPKQELFIDQHWPLLQDYGIHLGIAGGAVVDFLSEEVRRAPKWIQRIRMEWVWRLLQEPQRMWRRYLLGNLRFLGLLIKDLNRRPE